MAEPRAGAAAVPGPGDRTAVLPVEPAEIAGALARLLRTEERLLLAAIRDPEVTAPCVRGLEWLAADARELDAPGLAGEIEALVRVWRGREAGGAPAARVVRAAETCRELALRLEAAGELSPLGERSAVPVAPPAAVDLAGLAPRPLRIPPGTEVLGAPADLAELVRALCDYAGSGPVLVTKRVGVVELEAAAAAFHGPPPASRRDLARLDEAAAVVGAVLLAAAGEERWSRLRLRLPAAGRRTFLVAAAHGVPIAVPWHAVLDFRLARRERTDEDWPAFALPGESRGPASGDRPEIVLGRGLKRLRVPVDWLFGRVAGRSEHGETPPWPFLGDRLLTDDGDTYWELDLSHLAGTAEWGLGGGPEAGPGPAPEPAPQAAPEAAPEAASEVTPWAAPEPEPVPQPKSLAEPASQPQPAPAEGLEPRLVPADNPPGDRTFAPVLGPGPAPESGPLRALIADDSITARVFLARLLRKQGVEAQGVADGHAALVELAARPYDLVFLDLEMPGVGGLEILENDAAGLVGHAVILVKSEEERRAAVAAGAVHVLFKPFAEDEVMAAVLLGTARARPGH